MNQKNLRVAIYARFSTEHQSSTSIDDQIRVCTEFARQKGFSVKSDLVFSDSAISGTLSSAKRPGYAALLAAIERGDVDVLFLDEVSRISRDAAELVHLPYILRQNGVRLITRDGTDSRDASFAMNFGFKSLMSSLAIEECSRRVRRGLRGQIERGFVVAQPSYGYDIKKVEGGSIFVVNENEAVVVREIFTRRANGESLRAIAKYLNEQQVPTACGSAAVYGHWGVTTVSKILHNTKFKGVYTVRLYDEEAQTNRDFTFPRPELAIVSEELWARCSTTKRSDTFNPKVPSPTVRAGRRSILTGILACGVCGQLLSNSGPSKAGKPGYRCDSCHSRRCVLPAGEKPAAVNFDAGSLEHLLPSVLSDMISDPELVALFKQRLIEMKSQDKSGALARAEADLSAVKLQRSRLLGLVEMGDEGASSRYLALKETESAAAERLEALKTQRLNFSPEELEAQLALRPPKSAIARVLKGDPDRVHAALKQIIPCIRYDRRLRHKSYEVTVFARPGVFAAQLTGTSVIDDDALELRYRISLYNGEPPFVRI